MKHYSPTDRKIHGRYDVDDDDDELSLCPPSIPFPSGLLTKILYAFLLPTMRATCLTCHHNLFTVMIFGGAYLKLLIPHFLYWAVISLSLSLSKLF
jgi:hypothetical protein